MAVIIPSAEKYCTDCDENFLCDKCNKLVNQTKEFAPNLYELKRQTPDEFRHMLPWYKDILNEC